MQRFITGIKSILTEWWNHNPTDKFPRKAGYEIQKEPGFDVMMCCFQGVNFEIIAFVANNMHAEIDVHPTKESKYVTNNPQLHSEV